MNDNDFQLFVKLLLDHSGHVLTRDKLYLLESRLVPISRKWGVKSLSEIAQIVRSGNDRELVSEIVEAMTTNESFFFRDTKPFDQFRDIVIPVLMKKRAAQRRIRVWSAACSSGQEPYSLAMLLNEMSAKLGGWQFEILATDISKQMIDRAESGIYSQFEVQRGLPITHLVKYFTQIGEKWQINKNIRDKIDFREFNLLNPAQQHGQFDVIYCRNVLIYFDQPTKTKVLMNLRSAIRDDGFLFLGGAETVLGLSQDFVPLQKYRGMYGLPKTKENVEEVIEK